MRNHYNQGIHYDMSSARKASIISYISVIFYIITGFFYTPLLVKTLGVSDYGIYSLAASLIGYFTIDFGIGAAQTRLIAKFIAENKLDKIKEVLGITIKIYFIIDIIILLALVIVYANADSIFTKLTPVELVKFKNVFLITGAFILLNFPLLPTKGLYQAFDRVFQLTVIDLIYRVINVSSIIIALLLKYDLYIVVIINVSTNLLAQIIKLVYIQFKERLKIKLGSKDEYIYKFITSFSFWATIAMIADKFFFGIIPFLLAIFTTTSEIAIFAIVISIEGYVLSMSKSLSGIFLPRIMKLVVHNGADSEKTDLMIKVGRIQLYVVGLLITGLICFGKEFIFYWLGPGFDKSYYCLILVLTPCVFHLTQTIAEELLYATNNVKYKALANVIGSFLSVLSIIIISPKYGAYGSAFGVFISFLIAHNLIIDIIYKKKLNIDMLKFLRECQGKILPYFFIMLLIGLGMQKLLYTPSFGILILKGIIWATITCVILWLFVLNRDEKNIILQLCQIKK